MVIDSSALVAIALGEPARTALVELIERARQRAVSSVTLLEAGMVLRARLGQNGVPVLYEFLERTESEIVPFDQVQARLALAAFQRFGKGMGHRAQLNFGDCAVYALAQSRAEPILALGEDFSATDIEVLKVRG
jgi:ribonuclease VapC